MSRAITSASSAPTTRTSRGSRSRGSCPGTGASSRAGSGSSCTLLPSDGSRLRPPIHFGDEAAPDHGVAALQRACDDGIHSGAGAPDDDLAAPRTILAVGGDHEL